MKYKEYKTIQLSNGASIKIIEDDRFNSIIFQTIYRVKITCKEDLLKCELLVSLLKRSTEKYKSTRDYYMKLNSLYNLKINIHFRLINDYLILLFTMNVLNSSIIGENIFIECLNLLKQAIYNPNIIDGCFDNDDFDRSKRSKIESIVTRNADKRNIAFDKVVNKIAPNSHLSYSVNLSVDDCEKIKNEEIVSFYRYVLENAIIDMYYGGVESELVLKLITEVFYSLPNLTKYPIALPKPIDLVNKTDIIYENITNEFIIMTFNTYININSKLYNSMIFLDHLFGATHYSLLNQKIREELNLAYSIHSYINNEIGLLVIVGEVLKDKNEIVINEVNNLLASIINGEFSDELMELVRKDILNRIQDIYDSLSMKVNKIVMDDLYCKNVSLYDVINKYKSIKKQDIIEVAKILKHNYTLIMKEKI